MDFDESSHWNSSGAMPSNGIADWHCRLHQLDSSKGKFKDVRKAREVQDKGACLKLKTVKRVEKISEVKWMCELCNKQITKKHSSVLCNSTMKHWIHLKCGNIRVKDYKKHTNWTCKFHRIEENQSSVSVERGEMENSGLQQRTKKKENQKHQTGIEKNIVCTITKRKSSIIKMAPQKNQFGDVLHNDNSGRSVSPQNDSRIEYEHPKVLSHKAAVLASASSASLGTPTKSIIGLPTGASVAATPMLNSLTCMDEPLYLNQTKKKPYQCPYEPECLQAFVRTAELKRHILVHTGEQPFQCPVCPFRTNRKFTLKQHCLHKHNINPEDSIFLQSSSDVFQSSWLTTSMGSVTDEIIGLPPGASVAASTPVLNNSTCMTEALDQDKRKNMSHKCLNDPVSTLVLTSPAELERNVLIHTGEQTLRCPVCPFSTDRKFKFWQHCLDRHDINPEDPILIQ